MLAGLTSVGALVLLLISVVNPYNDLTRVYTRAGAVILGVSAAILWRVFMMLLRRLDRSQ